MTSPASPPNRRKRRVVVASTVVVLGLCWWFWPRVDQRFVGTWRCGKWVMHFRDDLFVDNFTAVVENVRVLEIQGAARYRVVGSRLVVIGGAKGLQAVYYDLQRLFMPESYPPIYEGEIVSINPTTISLRSAEFGNEEMVLHRVE